MAKSKYGHLVKKLTFRGQTMAKANAREMAFMAGDDLARFNLNFILGVYNQTGDWAPGRGAHAHSFDECLIFFGYDDDNLGYLGSDMELALGKELEKHHFSVPTVVVARGGTPHCPLITMKVHKPFGHFHLALSPNYTAVPVKPEGKTDGTKYAHLVKELKVKEGPGGANAKQILAMSGEELEGLELNFSLGLHRETGQWYPGKGAQVHPYDRCLIFFGHNTSDLSYLGAELTIDIGEEHEKHTFNLPTVVSLPRGLPHFPIVCNKVDRPYGVLQVGLGPRDEARWID
jgi:hypothetical protein